MGYSFWLICLHNSCSVQPATYKTFTVLVTNDFWIIVWSPTDFTQPSTHICLIKLLTRDFSFQPIPSTANSLTPICLIKLLLIGFLLWPIPQLPNSLIKLPSINYLLPTTQLHHSCLSSQYASHPGLPNALTPVYIISSSSPTPVNLPTSLALVNCFWMCKFSLIYVHV